MTTEIDQPANVEPSNGVTLEQNGTAVVDNTPGTDVIPLDTLETKADPNFHDQDEIETTSLKSTDAVVDKLESGLDNSSIHEAPKPSEQDLNPDLAKFMQGCQEGSLDLVKELVESGSIKVNDTFSDGISGLHWACINNRLTLVKYLVVRGADPNLYGGELRATPLHWACRNGLVYIVQYLISNTSADPSLRDLQTYNALHLAVHSSNITLVVYLLLSCCDQNSKKKLYIDEPDGSNRTALHWASYQNDVFTVNALLKFGADVSKTDDSLFIPLHWCFMRGHKNVMKALVESGSDIFFKNDSGKDSFDIARDMNCLNAWRKVLIESGLDPKNNWAPKVRWVSPKVGKVLTYLAPFVLLPISLNICNTSQGLAFPKLVLAFASFAFGIFVINKTIIPTYLIDNKPLPKSPILAGIFSATAFWCIIIWIFKVLPATLFSNFFANLFMGIFIAVFVWSFFKAMFINPGFVPTPTDNVVILSQVEDLLGCGKFDTDHFCVNSFVRKPIRSRYSRHNKKLVARFDHYCPWVYNEIGVRNHKLFITFVYALNLAILLFTYLTIQYFDKSKDSFDSDDEDNQSLFCRLIDDDLCYGYKNNQFHFNLLVWCWLQYIWIFFLCLVQTFQILRGLTTWEFSSLNSKIYNPRSNHSTVPEEVADSLTQPSRSDRKHNELQTCLNLLGIDQFVMTIKMTIASVFNRNRTASVDPLHIDIPTDYGLKQNWLDFWIIGEPNWRNVFYLPIEGENNLNGEVVDYYKLYEYPPKSSSQVV
ncbi:Akr1 protein [Candida orthopsilosis Co 90-125]|uniref:Palmitoyltransferase n=1 Tax=Candida orthopsilosis (strain 90-125) TaxID=1136231 RepID=H8WVU8_CANO9|nr:Akr1 protein [Candida orthopsilosis Co 90-125]CCG20572.1 Akr1 protein [Candida orthopsilosis Co 90-125]